MPPKYSATDTKPQKPFKQRAEAEALFISMGDGAITTDEYGKVTRVNKAAVKMFGYKENELIGKPFLSTIEAVSFDGQKLNIIDRPITRAFLTGKPASGKMYYLTKNGRYLPVAVNISPIMIGDKPVGSISLIRDITLEFEVDRMKSEFISLASHQLRTPLSAIKTYTHMLDDGYMGKLSDAQKESLHIIISATNRMNELISTLLNITKIESGTISVNPKKLKLDEVIKEVMPELSLLANSKDINLSLKKVGKQDTVIRTDALIAKEIVTNLVSNAIKYTPEKGSVAVIIKPKKKEILVEIHDTGWGIPSRSQEKIFSKFYRGSNIIKRVTSGTGLGLYLVKGLIEALDGKIWFESEEGKGTSFFFILPRSSKSLR